MGWGETEWMWGVTPGQIEAAPSMREAGIRWVRAGLGYPGWTGEGEVRGAGRLRGWRAAGFEVLGATFSPGVMRAAVEGGDPVWHPAIPESEAAAGSADWWAAVGDGCERLARSHPDVALWQIANEPDIAIFRGPLDDEQMLRFLRESAAGVKRGNPKARCGVNLGDWSEGALALGRALYGESGELFDYVGLDGYFGSWQKGGPETWRGFIEAAYEQLKRPIVINEWGYSSISERPGTPTAGVKYNQDVCATGRWPRVWREGHTEDEQAAYVSEGLRIFRSHPAVVGQFFFKWSDDAVCWQCRGAGCPAECGWGLVNGAGEPKKAWSAYRSAAMGTG